MPSGTWHQFSGRLLRVRDSFQLVLDGGQCWQLSLPYSAESFAGRKVIVVGERDEDGCLFVRDLRPV
jgi:hypothetical protein